MHGKSCILYRDLASNSDIKQNCNVMTATGNIKRLLLYDGIKQESCNKFLPENMNHDKCPDKYIYCQIYFKTKSFPSDIFQ